ncbi:MAG: hypothetical protein WAV21_01005 [Minisyncoccia bacterium]
MRRARHRPSFKDIALATLFTLGILWFSYLTWGIFAKEERARRDVAKTRAEIALLETREATLRADLQELGTPRGQEAALRDTRGVARPGEEVIIVVPPSTPAAAPPTIHWWQKIFNWF